ncbi:MAG: MATE family efflux transporter [Gammaproteobacteria bacterium]|nr:MAG: MATE family efflux transporter [Gammaproteobacteria bacterium]
MDITGASTSAKSIRALLDIALSPVNKLLFISNTFSKPRPGTQYRTGKTARVYQTFSATLQTIPLLKQGFFCQNVLFKTHPFMLSSPISRQVFQIALPMTLASISVPLLGLVDTGILGHLSSDNYLAAVAAGSNVLTLLFWLFAFLRMGSTGLTARAWGAGDTARCKEILCQSLLLAALLGVALVLLRQPIVTTVLYLIAPSPEVLPLAAEYSLIRVFAAPATLMTYCAIGWLLGIQRARTTLALMLFVNLANIALDFLFIVGFGWNSRGAALASLWAEYMGAVFALSLVVARLRVLPTSWHWTRLSQWRLYREFFTVNRHLFVRTALLLFTMTFFTAQGARQGDVVLAANAILMQLLLLVAFTQDGFAHAAESLAGQAIGARKTERFYQICMISTFWGLVIALAATLTYGMLPARIVSLFTDLPAVAEAALVYWPWLTALPLVGLLCFMADGIFIGSGKTRAMQDSMLVAVLLVFLPVWFFSRPLGNHGLWCAYLSFLAARSLLMGGIFIHYSRHQAWISSKT